MLRRLGLAASVICTLVAVPGPTKARPVDHGRHRILTYVQTYSTPEGAAALRGQITLLDHLVRDAPLDISYTNLGRLYDPGTGTYEDGTFGSLAVRQLLGLVFTMTYHGGYTFGGAIEAFEAVENAALGAVKSVVLQAGPGQLPDGRIYFNQGGESDFTVDLAGATFSGTTASEGFSVAPPDSTANFTGAHSVEFIASAGIPILPTGYDGEASSCYMTGRCQFSGIVVTSVPEPGTLVLLASALLGLAALRSRQLPRR